jgi:alpha-amylase
MLKSKYIFLLLSISLLSACQNHKDDISSEDMAKVNGHPAWIMQGNIYEVNVRQYTPEGTFNAFANQLERLQNMGVQTLWFMPIQPISKLDRKGALGSYYAVQNYTEINPEFGNMDDWKSLVKRCHSMGLKVIIDWVPNHTGADHSWLINHTDFYVLDSITKKPISPFDWTDTRKLNYQNIALQDTMIQQMKFWIKETGIDGFRCDVAGEVPDSFWVKCIKELKKEKNIFMLAEGDRKGLHESGFDATYAWNDFKMMKDIAAGKIVANDLDDALEKSDSLYPKNALRMFFTSNHDENTWNKADYATMPGAIHAPFAVLTQTLKNSIPLIYSGQEEPFLDSLSFFYKDTLHFSKYERASFYKKLLRLRTNNDALSADANFKRIKVGDEKSVYAFTRDKGKNKVLVIVNLSKQPQKIMISEPGLQTKATEIFQNKSETLTSKPWMMNAWGYAIYEFK